MTSMWAWLKAQFVWPAWALLRDAATQARAQRGRLLAVAALGLLLAATLAPWDLPLLNEVSVPYLPTGSTSTLGAETDQPPPPPMPTAAAREQAAHPWLAAAKWWSKWGDYPTGTLMLVAAVWIAGTLRRRARWQRAALAALLAASLAGLTADVCRFAAGRVRPRAVDRGQAEAGFHGPGAGSKLFDAKYMSFVSAHSATSAGTAVGLAAALGPPGWLALGGAACVVWSRLYLREHHPSDVCLGTLVGLLFALPLGLAARREADEPRVVGEAP